MKSVSDHQIAPRFAPGFRLSALDVLVLIAGAVGATLLWTVTWWWGFVVAFVVAHFFLFCNVFRLARPLELIWASLFIGLAGSTIIAETPGWFVTVAGSLCVTAVVIALEMRKPSYHGVGWQRINPNLSAWWESRVAHDSAR